MHSSHTPHHGRSHGPKLTTYAVKTKPAPFSKTGMHCAAVR